MEKIYKNGISTTLDLTEFFICKLRTVTSSVVEMNMINRKS